MAVRQAVGLLAQQRMAVAPGRHRRLVRRERQTRAVVAAAGTEAALPALMEDRES